MPLVRGNGENAVGCRGKREIARSGLDLAGPDPFRSCGSFGAVMERAVFQVGPDEQPDRMNVAQTAFPVQIAMPLQGQLDRIGIRDQ